MTKQITGQPLTLERLLKALQEIRDRPGSMREPDPVSPKEYERLLEYRKKLEEEESDALPQGK